MDLGKRFLVNDIIAREFDHRMSEPVPTYDNGWLISFQDDPEVIILDAQLKETQRIDLQAQTKGYESTYVTLSQDGQWFAVSENSGLRITDRQGVVRHRFLPNTWKTYLRSNGYFDNQNRLWIVWPGDNPGTDDRLMLIDPASGKTLFQEIIKSEDGSFNIYPGPYPQSVMIEVDCGQEGCYLYFAQLTDAGLEIREYPFYDRIFYDGGFSPDGKEFVTGAQYGDALMVHSFPSGEIVASLESEAIFANDTLISEYTDHIHYQAMFLDQDHIIVTTLFCRLLLIRRADMQLLGTVWPTGYEIEANDIRGKPTTDPKNTVDYWGELTSIHPAGSDKLLAVFNERLIRLLDISTLLMPIKSS